MKMKKLAAFVLAAAVAAGTCTTAFADSSTAATDYQSVGVGGYTTPKTTTDENYVDIVTATAHRAAVPVVDMLGANLTSSYGALNGDAPTGNTAADILADANTRWGLRVWATSKNSAPDPYFVNYYYNFYADAMSLSHASYALINDNRAGNPAMADTQSTSLSTRPDVVIGISANGNVSNTTGYDSQLATINSGLSVDDDDYYDPELVPYNHTNLDTMVTTVNNTATAIINTGMSYRYGDPATIADKYEQYVQGIQGYIMQLQATYDATTGDPLLEKKTVAIVTDYDTSTGLYTVAGSASSDMSNRYVEYTKNICDNIESSASATYTKAQLIASDADVIILFGRIDDDTDTQFRNDVSSFEAAGKQMIYGTPETVYGITMQSVENAMGLAYIAGQLYGTDSDTDPLNCYNLLRYFYITFWHINNSETDNDDNGELLHDALTDTHPHVEQTNDALPTVTNLTSTIETAFSTGETYYDAH